MKLHGFGVKLWETIIVSACTFACTHSQEDAAWIDVSDRTENLTSALEDALEFHASARVDQTGKVSASRIRINSGSSPVKNFDLSALPPKPADPSEPGRSNVEKSLAERIETAPNASSEVLIVVDHDAPFGRITRVRTDLPRESDENQERLAIRAAEIAAIGARRKTFRDPIIDRIRAFGGTIKDEYDIGNILAAVLPNSGIEQLAKSRS